MTEDEWYLITLAEEASELIKAVMKTLRFTAEGHHPSRPSSNNRKEMSIEALDVRVLHELCLKRGLLNAHGANDFYYNYAGKRKTVERMCELAKKEGKISGLPIVSVR